MAKKTSTPAPISDAEPLAPVKGMDLIVTPEMAANWRKHWDYIGQRPFRPWHCDNLTQEMRSGRFRKNTQVAFMRYQGRYYCTNGQHTLEAVARSGVPQTLCISVEDASSMEDVADDFSRHDTGLARQFGDALAAHAVHEDLGVTRSALHIITAAVTYFASVSGESSQRAAQQLTHDQKIGLVRKHGALARQAFELFEGATTRGYFTRRTTMVSAMACLRADPDRAKQFYRAMALDDGLRVNDPRKTLLDWLRTRTTPGGRYGTNSGSVKVAADHELVKAIAAAWNAWVDGRDLQVISLKNFDAPTADFKNVGSLTVRLVRAAPNKR